MNHLDDPTIDPEIRDSAELTQFVTAIRRIQNAASPTEKRSELIGYFASLDEREGACACWLLGGGVASPAPLSKRELRRFVLETTGLPNWMWERCRVETDGVVELAAKLLPGIPGDVADGDRGSLANTIASILGSSRRSPRDTFDFIWKHWDGVEREFLFNLSLGQVHRTVDFSIVAEAAKRWTNVPEWLLHRRILQFHSVDARSWVELFRPASKGEQLLVPDSFETWESWDGNWESLGAVDGWTAEWVMDGRDLQVVRRSGTVGIWARNGWVQGKEFDALWEWAKQLNRDVVLQGKWVAEMGHSEAREGDSEADDSANAGHPYFSVSRIHDSMNRDLTQTCDSSDEFREANGRILESFNRGREAVQGELFSKPMDTQPPSWPVRFCDRFRAKSWEELRRKLDVGKPGAVGLVLRAQRLGGAAGAPRRKAVFLPRPTNKCLLVMATVRTVGAGLQGTEMEGDFAVRDGENWVNVLRTRFSVEGGELDRLGTFVEANATGRFGPVRVLRPELVVEVEYRDLVVRKKQKLNAQWSGIRVTRLRWECGVSECLELSHLLLLSL